MKFIIVTKLALLILFASGESYLRAASQVGVVLSCVVGNRYYAS